MIFSKTNSTLFLALLTLLFGLSACGWDDDREYEVRTQHGFFLMEEADGKGILKQSDGTWESDWETNLNLNRGDVSQILVDGGLLWVSDITQNQILSVEPATNNIATRISTGSISPHYFAVGSRYTVIADTTSEQLHWFHQRKEELISLDIESDFGGTPRTVLYNSGTFYVQLGTGTVLIFDEAALAQRTRINFGRPIVSMAFERFKNVQILTASQGMTYNSLISGVDNTLARDENQVNYTQLRSTPYFDDVFRSEWLEDVRLENAEILSGNLNLFSAADQFDVDFFESVLYAQLGTTLFEVDMTNLERLDTLSVTGSLVTAEFWRGE